MDKFLAYLAQLGTASASLADALDMLASGLPDGEAKSALNAAAAEARKIVAAEAEVLAFVQHPDFNLASEFVSHHGNLPGTPEERAAAAAAGLTLDEWKKQQGR